MTELVYENVPYWRYFEQTVTRLRHPGVLLVVPSPNGGVNAMTIGWGTIGTIWSKAIFAVMVRPSRYTYGLMESSDSFTVCVFGLDKKDAVDYCGTYSGRDGDKLAACRLSTMPSATVSAPGIAGCPLIYECRIVHKHDIVPANLAADIKAYPRGDYHRVYHGEILATRALPDAAARLG